MRIKIEAREIMLYRDAARALKGSDRRLFMARTVTALGFGGQQFAERELGWDRETIRKGICELKSGIVCVDAFNFRGRKSAEVHLPNLLNDIKKIVDGQSQIDATFKTLRLYTRLSAREIRKQLIIQNGYKDDELPTIRTISNKLNLLGYRLRTVTKGKPKKNSRNRSNLRSSA